MVGNKSSAGKIEDVDEVEKYQLLGFRTQECRKRLVLEVEGEFEGEGVCRAFYLLLHGDPALFSQLLKKERKKLGKRDTIVAFLSKSCTQ